MPRSSYVLGVPYPTPSSKLQQQQEKEAMAHAAAIHAQQAAAQLQAAHQQQHPQIIGQGYGVRMPLQQVPQKFHGKPAFYDSERGILFDGHQAFYYASDVPTAIELGHSGHHHQQQQNYSGQQAYLFVPANTAIERGAHHGESPMVSHGFGQRVLLQSDVAQQMGGKPAHYDSNRNVYYDGQNLYAYVPSSQESGQPITAIESSGQHHSFDQQLSPSQQQQRDYYLQQVREMNNRSGYLFSI